MKPDIVAARERVAKLAERDGHINFAAEVRAGCWDHRGDVQAALRGEPLKGEPLSNADAYNNGRAAYKRGIRTLLPADLSGRGVAVEDHAEYLRGWTEARAADWKEQ